MIDLSAAGLTQTEAKCYAALLDRPEWKPSELAKSVNETRTNCYKILDNLVALGLAERFDKDKKLHYRATNPSRLLDLARARRAEQEKAEKELELQANDLLANYFKIHEQPGVRFFQGKDSMVTIFKEIAGAKDEVVFIHTKAGIDFYSFNEMHNLRMLAVDNKVQRRALTPDVVNATQDFDKTDPLVFLKRTWYDLADYTAPVEWGAFDDKLYIISYGAEAMGMIIQSAQMAAAFKQLFNMLERGQRLLPEYGTYPTRAKARGVTTHSR